MYLRGERGFNRELVKAANSREILTTESLLAMVDSLTIDGISFVDNMILIISKAIDNDNRPNSFAFE